ncbi:hypothetical protein AAFF_G00317730 [Aldrovandia affinis]|uniref:G-protein coupled receptors family 1 profile domain-containing protein n=1 Tax=Aldrovandia affinis TaxID=143900 RepID=A0AAD7R735_9TELE|nr:hypothetical protein AAFF_G00317730 [Aldrovandia affinis]
MAWRRAIRPKDHIWGRAVYGARISSLLIIKWLWGLEYAYCYIFTFILDFAGICFAVWKNHHMRTVTNYFIVNLSLADILVTIICLPASLVVDITETWFFGTTLCKVLPYLQTISVSVSVLTLSCIAQDRWYAICHPLMFKSTAKRARKSIVLIWVVSCIIMIPQAVVMECSSLLPELTNKTSLFTVCDEHWEAEIYPKVYHTCFFIATYFAPLCLMVLAYIQIFQKLWCQQIPGTSTVLQRWKSLQCSAQSPGPGESVRVRTSAVSAEIKQVRVRRKTARMLMVVLLVFALCYLPISVLNIMKRAIRATYKMAWTRSCVASWFESAHTCLYKESSPGPIFTKYFKGKIQEKLKAAKRTSMKSRGPSTDPCGTPLPTAPSFCSFCSTSTSLISNNCLVLSPHITII